MKVQKTSQFMNPIFTLNDWYREYKCFTIVSNSFSTNIYEISQICKGHFQNIGGDTLKDIIWSLTPKSLQSEK